MAPGEQGFAYIGDCGWTSHPWKCSSQVEWGLEQHDLVASVPTHGRSWNEMSCKVPSKPNHPGIPCCVQRKWAVQWQLCLWLVRVLLPGLQSPP